MRKAKTPACPRCGKPTVELRTVFACEPCGSFQFKPDGADARRPEA